MRLSKLIEQRNAASILTGEVRQDDEVSRKDLLLASSPRTPRVCVSSAGCPSSREGRETSRQPRPPSPS